MGINKCFKQYKRLTFIAFTHLFFIISLVCTGYAREGSQHESQRHFLWSIKTDYNTVYLLGSMHIMKGDAYPLAEEIENAYNDCQKIVFETDMVKMKDPSFQGRMLSLGRYPEGQTLKENISEETYGQLQDKLAAIGLPVTQFDGVRPWLCALTLTILEFQRMGFNPNMGLDKYFFDKAVKDGKKLGFFEPVESQLSLFTEMDESEQESFLRQSLKDIEVMGKMAGDMFRAWKNGDTDELDLIINMSFEDSPEMYDLFIINRNKNWIAEIVKLAHQNENVLIIVGSGHLTGNDSVLRFLDDMGYKIEQR